MSRFFVPGTDEFDYNENELEDGITCSLNDVEKVMFWNQVSFNVLII